MTRISKLITASFLFISTTCQASTPEVQEWDTSKALANIEARFDQAPDRVAKAKIATQPLNKEALKDQQAVEGWDLTKLTAEINPEAGIWHLENGGQAKLALDKTCPLLLAIAYGRVSLVARMLETIENANALNICAWGYRQPYSAAHVALDPYPISKIQADPKNQLAIIDLLGKKGADFNKIIDLNITGIYTNPPLAAGVGRGWGYNDDAIIFLRARAMLYGADPTIKGSCHSMVNLTSCPDYNVVEGEFTDEALETIGKAWSYYLELSKSEGHAMTLAPSVKAEFAKFRDLEVQRLQAMKF